MNYLKKTYDFIKQTLERISDYINTLKIYILKYTYSLILLPKVIIDQYLSNNKYIRLITSTAVYASIAGLIYWSAKDKLSYLYRQITNRSAKDVLVFDRAKLPTKVVSMANDSLATEFIVKPINSYTVNIKVNSSLKEFWKNSFFKWKYSKETNTKLLQ